MASVPTKIDLPRLYGLVLEEFKSTYHLRRGGTLIGMNYIGICAVFYVLKSYHIITEEEYGGIKKHFQDEKPTYWKHNEFYIHVDSKGRHTFTGGKSTYWWSNHNQRIAFLEKLIKITK